MTLGETMWRLSPPGRSRLEIATTLEIQVGGSESNTAIALSRLGQRVAWWSRLPDNPLGRHIANTLRAHGVDVSGVAWGGNRLGTYFVEFGSPPRPTQVVYDRAASSASEMQPDHFDWSLVRKSRWLHLTGITPALSASCLATMRRAVQEARDANVPYSFDLNHRAKLWSYEIARPIYDELASQARVVFGAERDVQALYGASVTLQALHERWNGAVVVVTRGGAGAWAHDGSGEHQAPAFPVDVVDRVGAGDSFSAGLLCALLDGKPLAEALRWGHAVAALKMTIPGDIALVSRAEVEHLLREGDSAIQR
jgi:2-dehydro-3-deoxygluconokinase